MLIQITLEKKQMQFFVYHLLSKTASHFATSEFNDWKHNNLVEHKNTNA